MKKFLGLRKLTTKDICVLGLLIAITFALGYISGYLRPTPDIKISISFISIFVASVIFGPVWGGVVGALADIISCIAVGAIFLPITAIEFVYGFIFGILFYKRKEKFYNLSVLICVVFQAVINIFVKSYFLAFLYGRTYISELIFRLPACIIQAVIVMVVLLFLKPYLEKFEKLCGE